MEGSRIDLASHCWEVRPLVQVMVGDSQHVQVHNTIRSTRQDERGLLHRRTDLVEDFWKALAELGSMSRKPAFEPLSSWRREGT